MEPPQHRSTALFDVYLRLRPSNAIDRSRFLDVEKLSPDHAPTHITVKPPLSDHRKRAVEKFAFTKVFEEHAGQRELFESTGSVQLVEGVLGQTGREGRDGLLATLGVTGSGKSHTILGSKSQRGITQLTLDLLFQHASARLVNMDRSLTAFQTLCAADVSESHLLPAANFLDSIYSEACPSRGATPAPRGATPGLPKRFASKVASLILNSQETSFLAPSSSRRHVPRFSVLPTYPPICDIPVAVDNTAEYAILISMYEVHNDRIFDLLATTATSKPPKRRALLFKPTERSPDRKVVAGLKKIICSDLEEALLVLETGLQERRVADTSSNAVSSRSHGFFCVEVKKRHRGSVPGPWTSSTLTLVDLAGSERARTAKTAGATLAEAGKINESLMYLGQCMQMQSDNATALSPNLVPFRQCKLTELLFSNSFASSSTSSKAAQKAIMIVTADPLGDFNATSQILRYSALAREVTVPRVPSVNSTILSSRPTTPSALQEELDAGLSEIARLREELDITQMRLEEEVHRRREAEHSWKVAESRVEAVEAEVREEIWGEMEDRLALEQRRWRAARDEELEMRDAHLDAKIEIAVRGNEIWEDEVAQENQEKSNGMGAKDHAFDAAASDEREKRLKQLESENAILKERLVLTDIEQGSRSPSKKMRILKTRKWTGSGMGLEECL